MYGFSWDIRQELFFGLKILSDNMDQPNLTNALKLNDTEALKLTIEQLNEKGQKFVESQKKEISFEHNLSENAFKSSHTVYLVFSIQVMVIILLVGYQIFSFRKVILDRFYY